MVRKRLVLRKHLDHRTSPTVFGLGGAVFIIAATFFLFAPIPGAHAVGSEPKTHLVNSLSDVIDCSAITPRPLFDDSDAFDTILSYCMRDPRCAELYGQVPGVKPALFRHLFQVGSSHDPPWYLEDGMLSTVHGKNMSQINEEICVLKLKNAILDLHVCDTNERPILKPLKGTYDCVCQADRLCEQNTEDSVLHTALLAMIALSLIVWVVVKIWEVLQRRLPPPVRIAR